MKKWFKTILPVIVFAFILLIPGIQAKAGTITSVTAAAGTDEFTVSGVAGEGVLSVAIFVYDATGTDLLQMESVAVDASHAYTDTFAAEEGTKVTLTATPDSGYKFKAWTVESGGVTLADSASASTTFSMPAANDTVYWLASEQYQKKNA